MDHLYTNIVAIYCTLCWNLYGPLAFSEGLVWGRTIYILEVPVQCEKQRRLVGGSEREDTEEEAEEKN